MCNTGKPLPSRNTRPALEKSRKNYLTKQEVGIKSHQCTLKGIVSRDFLVRFMMLIIKSVLFVQPLLPLIICYSFINFILDNKVLNLYVSGQLL